MKKLLLLICLTAVVACNPITTPITHIPALFIGLNDEMGKRKVWLDRANKGDVYSMYELAESYCCNSMEGKVNNEEALRWYCQAAKNGFGKAQTKLGKIYEGKRVFEGVALTVDYPKAYVWYSLASRRGLAEPAELKAELQKKMTGREIRQAKSLMNQGKNIACGNSAISQTPKIEGR